MPADIITQKCSNCGKINKYRLRQWHGREQTACQHCGSMLSVCSGFLGLVSTNKDDAVKTIENIARRNRGMSISAYLKKMGKSKVVLN